MNRRRIIYALNVTLDGFIAGPGGEIDWSVPDEELTRALSQIDEFISTLFSSQGFSLSDTSVFPAPATAQSHIAAWCEASHGNGAA